MAHSSGHSESTASRARASSPLLVSCVAVAVSARIGSVAHKLAFGVSYMDQELGNAYSPGTEVADSNIYNPVPIPAGPSERLTPQKASSTGLLR